MAAFKKDREGDQGRLKALTKELHDLQARSKDRQGALDHEVGTMHSAEGRVVTGRPLDAVTHPAVPTTLNANAMALLVLLSLTLGHPPY